MPLTIGLAMARDAGVKAPEVVQAIELSARLMRFYVGEGVDRDQFRIAIARGLQNQDGHARSKVSGIHQRLTFDEMKPLLPAIRDAVENPAPRGEMFADGVRLNGLKILAAHHVEEGITACAD